MSDNRNYIVSLCEQLQSNHQQPTVGMIRKLAERALPLPEVISVLRHWKADPTQFQSSPDQHKMKDKKSKTADQRITELENHVASLEKHVNHLTDLVMKKIN